MTLMRRSTRIALAIGSLVLSSGMQLYDCLAVDKEQSVEGIPNTLASMRQNVPEEDPLETQHNTAYLWEHVNMLRQLDQWELIFNCIHNELKKNWRTETFDATMGVMFELMDELSTKFSQKSKSVFYIPQKGSQEEKNSQARRQHFNIATRNQARDTAQKYDMLRDNLKLFISILEQHYPIEDSTQASSVQEILRLKKKADFAKERLVKERCIFISNSIVDPVLAETEKYIFLSRGKWWTLGKPDYKELCTSVLLMANAFNSKWLFECDWETRYHFYQVQTKLKEMCAKRRWEDFIALTTLADSWDPSKYRGADAWWDGKY